MVVPALPEAQPHRFVGTVRQEIVESSGTGELLFRRTDRFGGRLFGQSLKMRRGLLPGRMREEDVLEIRDKNEIGRIIDGEL